MSSAVAPRLVPLSPNARTASLPGVKTGSSGLADNEAAVAALAKSYFEALDMIKTDQTKAYEIMGADVKQTGEQLTQVRTALATAQAGQAGAEKMLASQVQLHEQTLREARAAQS